MRLTRKWVSIPFPSLVMYHRMNLLRINRYVGEGKYIDMKGQGKGKKIDTLVQIEKEEGANKEGLCEFV